ncbi:MAG TPA: PQ-loop domain-containing transporter [Gammaproteobacteria bacterium]|nr:PQ-loop domain-containing transporter [Gammaproteobacteria bacterium]
MWWQYLIEMFFSLGLFINAALFVPQAIQLYRTKDSTAFSLITFGGFNFIQIFTVLHGLLMHDYILATGMFLSVLTCGTVTVMIVVYRKGSTSKN